MANPNPREARKAKAAKRREALVPVLENLLDAMTTAHELLESEDPPTRLKAVHGVCQVSVSYARVYEVGEIEGRLEEIEARLAEVTK